MGSYKTQTIGYPRIGAQREMKRALESYWKGQLQADELVQTLHQVEGRSMDDPTRGRNRLRGGGR